ncbi:MAG: 2-oxoglutarate dehydrogenase E1 component [Alphaproteobacteria bacterium]|nr:2-oxoglutarate dehydrogenase E1 component [Alphaproteobacteria bacterium]
MTRGPDTSSFLFGPNGSFVTELYARYLEDPAAVDPSWRAHFEELRDDATQVLAEVRGASWAPKAGLKTRDGGYFEEKPAPVKATKADPVAAADTRAETLDSIRALMLIRAFRVRGHLIADLDPLKLEGRDHHPELDPKTYGFTDADMDRPIFIDNVLGLETATMREIMSVVRSTYCATIGVEFMHIQHPDQKSWIQERIEGNHYRPRFTAEGKRKILKQLIAAEEFEKFLQTKYTGTKRFGVEGAESLIPLLNAVLKRAAENGVEEIVIGMPHRGRLNVLSNIMKKPYRAIFSEFQGGAPHPTDMLGSGDVKYHLGTSADRDFDGTVLHLSLTANPSHLEAVNPVVVGKVRAKQNQKGDTERKRVMSILLHGDAAFAGQGLVPETIDLSELRGYRTGGTVHIIVNNQIGFTTSPGYSRFSPYPSDIAKGVQSPILHVNGDDPEAVVHVGRLAADFRQAFAKDIVIDMFCYRRAGHNEIDEPAFTQPIMYKTIAQLKTTRELYAERLVAEGTLSDAEREAYGKEMHDRLLAEFDAAKSFKPNKADWLEGRWAGLKTAEGGARRGKTAVAPDLLKEIGAKLTALPAGFKVHRTVQRMLDAKKKTLASGEGIDWATGEALAFGSLLLQGFAVRLSGQDSGRGTFSHRHAVLRDQESEDRFVPLAHLRDSQAPFEVIDSPLSEAAVLGFEYGYTLSEPNALVLWEAQFGDFANGAQVIIDQFIASGESKWLRMSGLVMLLPHGFEGQGPEHSSARLERYLQLSAEDNWQVVNLTTPANYFHALRRQLHREFRKPLIVMTPKSLLRHKLATSALEDFGDNTSFHRVLWDPAALKADKDIKRVVLCSGKVYYDLYEERARRKIDDIYLMRVEQLYPFPADALAEELKRFKKADVVWCQEEPKNQGAWFFVDPRVEEVLKGLNGATARAAYVGRAEAAAPATGSYAVHNAQQEKLLGEALTV